MEAEAPSACALLAWCLRRPAVHAHRRARARAGAYTDARTRGARAHRCQCPGPTPTRPGSPQSPVPRVSGDPHLPGPERACARAHGCARPRPRASTVGADLHQAFRVEIRDSPTAARAVREARFRSSASEPGGGGERPTFRVAREGFVARAACSRGPPAGAAGGEGFACFREALLDAAPGPGVNRTRLTSILDQYLAHI